MRIPVLTVAALLGISGLFPAAHAASVVVPDLYAATVITESRSQAVRESALRDAFTRVLVKATGSDEVLLAPQTEMLVDRAAELVTLYRFEPLVDDAAEADTGTSEVADEAPADTRYAFTAQFDPRAVQVTLREAGFAVWPARRPLTLVWLVAADGGIVSDEGKSGAAAFVDAAERRGLPLVWPSMDLVDQRAIDPGDVTGLFVEQIRDASRRYDPALILVGRLRDESSLWAARWTLIEPAGASETWREQEPTRDAALTVAVSRLGDELLRRYGVAGSTDGATDIVDVAVTGIASLEDYGRVMNFLGDLPPVSDTALVIAEANRVVVRLHTGAAREQIRQSIELGRLLVADDVDEADVSGLAGPGPLAYRVNR